MSEALKTNVLAPVATDAARISLLQRLWNVPSLEHIPLSYFEYYTQQCDLFSVEQDGYILDEKLSEPHISTHQDLIDIALTIISTDTDWASIVRQRQSCKSSSDGTAFPDAMIKNSINWTSRLMCMVDLGKFQYSFSSHKPLVWDRGLLRDFLHDIFSPERPCETQVRLEKIFNAVNLSRLAGIEIEWTSDLASHLSLREDDTKLLVFHHASFLENVNNNLLPPGLASETLRTISLLLPSSDRETKRWYMTQQGYFKLDSNGIRCRKLRADDRQIENFHYWRERLCILKQVFDEAEPSTLSQWWYDRRKGPQWYTFWLAVAVVALTIFFGIVQSIEGALQVYKAYHPD